MKKDPFVLTVLMAFLFVVQETRYGNTLPANLKTTRNATSETRLDTTTVTNISNILKSANISHSRSISNISNVSHSSYLLNSSNPTNRSLNDNPPIEPCNVSYVKIGCYQDASIENSSFPSLILKPILPLISEGKSWSLRGEAWSTFLGELVCSCAQKAKELEYNYFGVKRFDQCWSGDTTVYYRNPASTGCLQQEMKSCNSSSISPCAGNSTSVFVYRL